jgi:hypothetical protein
MKIKDRFKAPLPTFWKRVRNISSTIAVVTAGVLLLPISLPVATVSALTYVVVVTSTIAGTSQFTKK